MTETPLDLNAIRAREQAATEGPWTLRDGFGPTRDGLHRFARIANEANATVLEEPYTGRDVAATRADAEFIASARTDVPRLLAEVERLTDTTQRIIAYRNTIGGERAAVVERLRAVRALAAQGQQSIPVADLLAVLGEPLPAETRPAVDLTAQTEAVSG